MRHRVRVGLDAHAQIKRLQCLDDLLAGGEALHAIERDQVGADARNLLALDHEGRIVERDTALGVENVDQRQVVALAHLEIVEVVRGGDLHRAGALLGVGVIVADDGNPPPHQRQNDMAPDQVFQLFILGMHGDRRIAEHGLGTRRRHLNIGRGIIDVVGLALNRIVEIVQVAVGGAIQNLAERDGVERFLVAARPFVGTLAFDLLDLDVGDRRLQLRIPVDEALVAIDQPLAIELHEHLEHGLRQALVHGEALARPVAGGAKPLQLVDDGPAGFGLPLPDALEKRLAAHVAATRLLAFRELALDDHLRGDARVVGARLPEHVLAAHAFEPAKDILQGIVERVAHVQVAGDVRRRNDDAIGRRARALGPSGAEGARLFPSLRDAALDGGGIECLVHHGGQRVPAISRLESARLPRSQCARRHHATSGDGQARAGSDAPTRAKQKAPNLAVGALR